MDSPPCPNLPHEGTLCFGQVPTGERAYLSSRDCSLLGALGLTRAAGRPTHPLGTPRSRALPFATRLPAIASCLISSHRRASAVPGPPSVLGALPRRQTGIEPGAMSKVAE